MEGWKRVFVRAAGFGTGVAVIIALCGAGLYWWSQRPPKPKQWNEKAITAIYEGLDTGDDKRTLLFAYTLINQTDNDFSLSGGSTVHLGASLKQYQNSLSLDDGKLLSVDYPIYIPARRAVRFQLHLAYPYPEPDDPSASDDVRHDYRTKLAVFVAKEMGNVGGFVLMDDSTRYQIDMPNGWDERAKEPLRVESKARQGK
jgi:hypothetical protein